MQGWAPDFISPLTEAAVASGCIDEIVPVAGQRSLTLARELARQEGIFAGISSGATLAAALEIAERSVPGTNIVCMLPDTGERYLSTPLFESIGESMNEEEIALSQSTPGYQFETNTQKKSAKETMPAESLPACHLPSAKVLAQENIDIDPTTQTFVDNVIKQESVVMFALEWCEFCWAVRKLFNAMGVNYYSVDLDSVAYQKDNLGGKVRQVLKQKLNSPTIPQIFIGGKLVGGASEVFDAFQSGALLATLDAGNIPHKQDLNIDSQSLLPNWIHPRKTA
jgi:cysteine synthase A